MEEQQIYVGLDIGTTKIAAVVARLDENNILNIAGVGTAPSAGLRRGVIIDIDRTVSSIRKAVEQAQLMAGCKIESVYAGVAGDHIRGIDSKGVIGIGSRDQVINELDVTRVVNLAKTVALPMDRQVIHILPQEFIVDGQDGIKNPVGMKGTRLECEVHIVTASSAAVQNVINCVNKAGFEVIETVLEPYASSLAVLDHNEQELGVAIMDIGGGTTDIVVYFDGSIRFTSVIGLGGQNVTNDLSHGLRTPTEQAEEIKKKYGCALQGLVSQDELVVVQGIHGRAQREIARSVLCAVIEPRMEEIFAMALHELEKSKMYDSLGAGVVLTGGASMLKGTAELAERVLGLPVKIGIPTVSAGLAETVKSPVFATGVGLILYGLMRKNIAKEQKTERSGSRWKKVFESIREFFEDLF